MDTKELSRQSPRLSDEIHLFLSRLQPQNSTESIESLESFRKCVASGLSMASSDLYSKKAKLKFCFEIFSVILKRVGGINKPSHEGLLSLISGIARLMSEFIQANRLRLNPTQIFDPEFSFSDGCLLLLDQMIPLEGELNFFHRRILTIGLAKASVGSTARSRFDLLHPSKCIVFV